MVATTGLFAITPPEEGYRDLDPSQFQFNMKLISQKNEVEDNLDELVSIPNNVRPENCLDQITAEQTQKYVSSMSKELLK